MYDFWSVSISDELVWILLVVFALYLVLVMVQVWMVYKQEERLYQLRLAWYAAMKEHMEEVNVSMGKMERHVDAVVDILEERL